MSQLHVVICSDLDKSNGGCETWLDYFLGELIRVGYYKSINVYHVQSDKAKEIYNDVNINRYTCKGFSNGIINVVFFSCFAMLSIVRNIKKNDQIILVGSTFVSIVGIFLCLYKKIFKKEILVITWVRSIALRELAIRSPRIAYFSKYLEKYLLKYTDYIITNGKDTYLYYTNCYGYNNKTFVVENAIPNNHLFDVPIMDKQKYINIAYMGRYAIVKGFDKYIRSVDKFWKKIANKNIIFHAFGHGELDTEIEKTNIVDHGKYSSEEIFNVLSKIDVVVFLNQSGSAAGVSHALLECMAAGRCIIAWDNLIHNQVCNKEEAFLVREDDVGLLVDIYKEIIEDPDIIVKKGKLAREKARRYTVKKHVNRFLKIVRGEK